MGFPKGFWHRKLDLFSGYFWVFLLTFIQTLFGIFTRIIFMRIQSDREPISPASSFSSSSPVSNSIFSEPKDEADFSNSSDDRNLNSEELESGKKTDSNDFQQESEPKVDISETDADTENISSEGEESPKLIFKFEYQIWKNTEELNGISREINDFVDADSASANKYEFMSGKIFSHFLEEPEVSNLTVKELYVHPIDNDIRNIGISSEKSLDQENHEGRKISKKSRDKEHQEEVVEFGNDQTENPNRNFPGKEVLSEEDFDFLSEDDFKGLGFGLNSISSVDSLFESELNCSTGDGFLSDTHFGTSNETDILSRINDRENAGKLNADDFDLKEKINSRDLDCGYEPDDFDEEEEEDRHIMMEELRKLEESETQNPEKISGEKLGDREKMPMDGSDESAKNDYEDSSQLETLWEHQDLVEQLKMELKKVRATGLPTILEDSESPRIMDDLKPWKIDEKLQYGTRINDVPKLYRSYRERMRKFDILNYQKMYAIGFLQSKDPLQSFSRHKNSSPAITFRLCRRKKSESESDPMKKFVRELYCDLEVVYVGQLCLSWEFLMWEYEKALEILESDQNGIRRYNEVAGEFQQFQVLLQRFLENEPFQGHRVENYVKNRCAMKNLLQVPVIREDNNKDKKRLRKEGEDSDAITSDLLVEILEESIRTIWRFIRADKDASGLSVKCLRETQVELQDPKDSELLAEIKVDLLKKEKRLRDILRSGNCILRKFRKREEDATEQVLYFFSQVDMKLVWRVLNMSRITTDQLAWCHNKLNKINFVNRRRIHVEPSFLLFPC